MFCGNCGKQVNEGELFCKNCGAPIAEQTGAPTGNEQQGPAAPRPAPMSKGRKGLPKPFIIIAVVIVVFIAMGAIFDLFDGDTDTGGPDSPSSSTSDSKGVSEDTVFNCAKKIIKDKLKAPSTAEFSEMTIEEQDEYGRYLVTTAVDAQNGFGAMIRSHYAVILRIEGERFYYSNFMAATDYEPGSKDMTIQTLKDMNSWGEAVEASD